MVSCSARMAKCAVKSPENNSGDFLIVCRGLKKFGVLYKYKYFKIQCHSQFLRMSLG